MHRRWRQRGVLSRRRKLRRRNGRWSIHHGWLRRALLKERGVEHAKRTTDETDDRRQRRQQLREITARETRNDSKYWNNHRTRQKQYRALFHALATRRHPLRLVRRTVNRYQAAIRQQLNHAIERETTTGAESHYSRNLLLTALRTKHGDRSSPTDSYDVLDNTRCHPLLEKHFEVCDRAAVIIARLDQAVEQHGKQRTRLVPRSRDVS